MRIIVLILALFGGVVTGGLGGFWGWNWYEKHVELEKEHRMVISSPELINRTQPNVVAASLRNYDMFHQRTRTVPFLLVGFIFGIAGGVLAMNRRGFSAALLLVAAGIGPVVVYDDPSFFIVTSVLLLAGLLSLLVR